MNRLAALLAFLALASACFVLAAAEPSGMRGMDSQSEKRAGVHRTTGVVKSVNAEKATVSIAHASIPELKWPAMTMSFAAGDRKMLENLQPGAKVEFEFVRQGSRYVITSIK